MPRWVRLFSTSVMKMLTYSTSNWILWILAVEGTVNDVMDPFMVFIFI